MTVELTRTISAPQQVFGVPGSPIIIVGDQNTVAKFNGKVGVGITSTVVRVANGDRNNIVLVNDSSRDIYLSKSSTAVLNEGILLRKRGGAAVIGDYLGEISAITDIAGSNLTVCEIDRFPAP